MYVVCFMSLPFDKRASPYNSECPSARPFVQIWLLRRTPQTLTIEGLELHRGIPMSTERAFTDLTFYETYYFANAIKNVLEDQFAYIRHLHDFYGDGRYLAYAPPFPRFSAFHNFISFVVDDMLDEDAKNIDLQKRQDTVVQFQGME